MSFIFFGRGAYAVLGSGVARIWMVGLIFSFQTLDFYDFCLSIFNHFNHQPVIPSKGKLDLFFCPGPQASLRHGFCSPRPGS